MKAVTYSLSLLLTTFALTGCGNSNAPQSSTSPAEAKTTESTGNTTKTEEVRYVSPLPDTAPTYSVAMLQYPPFKTRNEFGNVTGYDVDLIRAIGEESGFKVQIEEVEFKNLFNDIQSGQYDLALSGLTATPERQEVMAYSKPLSTNRVGYIVKAESDIKTPQDIVDKKVAVIAGSSLEDELKEKGIKNIVGKPTSYLTIEALLAGTVDAAIGEQPSMFYESQQFPDHPMRFIPLDAKKVENYVVYAPKSNQKIIEQVNEGLGAIIQNGKYQEISKKWFGDNASEISVK